MPAPRPGWTHRLSFPGPTGRRPPPHPTTPAIKPADGRLLPLQSASIRPAELPPAVGLRLARQTRQAIAEVEAAFDIPEDLLQALALVESGTTVGGEKHPWPWSLNSNGHGWRFASRRDALAALDRLLLAGFASVDLGALQVNLYWHGEDVSEFAHGLDPRENAGIAARYLSELHRQHGSWEGAVRHYHSYNPAHQQRYLCRVRAELARLGRNPSEIFAKTICG
ncbi:lytic transglycosylase domain-containing protein [Fodinicurvata halophila]